MEDQKFAPSVHDSTHSHAWMITLLIGCLALIAALSGLFAYKYYEPQESEIKDEPFADDEVNLIKTVTFDRGIFSNFEYPLGWHILVYQDNDFDYNWQLIANPEPIVLIRSAQFFQMIMTSFEPASLLGDQTLEEYVEERASNWGNVNPTTLSETTIGGQPAFIITGIEEYGGNEYEHIFVDLGNQIIKIQHYQTPGSESTGWVTIKQSLDFSDIK